jgi:hypothetical protein
MRTIDQIYRSVNWLLARAADIDFYKIVGGEPQGATMMVERTRLIHAALADAAPLSRWERENGPVFAPPSHPLPRCNFCASPRTNARRFGFTLVVTGPMRGLICDACLKRMRLERRLFYRTF